MRKFKMARTTIIIPGQDNAVLPGAQTVEGVRSMIGAEVPGLASMEGSVLRTDPATGDVTIEFRQRSGTKG
jgi:hypothetical protein